MTLRLALFSLFLSGLACNVYSAPVKKSKAVLQREIEVATDTMRASRDARNSARHQQIKALVVKWDAGTITPNEKEELLKTYFVMEFLEK